MSSFLDSDLQLLETYQVVHSLLVAARRLDVNLPPVQAVRIVLIPWLFGFFLIV